MPGQTKQLFDSRGTAIGTMDSDGNITTVETVPTGGSTNVTTLYDGQGNEIGTSTQVLDDQGAWVGNNLAFD